MENSLKDLLRSKGVVLKKAYGQNFLTDKTLLAEIVEKAGVTKEDTVLEIGCGAGALTAALAERAGRVVGYEIDKTLKPVLDETLAKYDNTEIVYKDIMKEEISAIENRIGNYILVANLPYYITTPIVMRFMENAKKMRAMVIMVQEEVALRFAAKEGTSDYGAVTVGIKLRGDAEVVIRVPREKFTPVPNVDSAVVKITVKEKFPDADLTKVRNVVRAGFSSRRKMLVNNIMNFYKLPRAEAENALKQAGIDLTCRGEKLSAEEYVRLAEVLEK